MAAVSPASPSRAGRGWMTPWRILFVGLGITILGLILSLGQHPRPPWCGVLLFTGLVVSGAAVARRLQTAGWDFDQRLESAGVLAVAAFAGLLAYFGFDEAWDSMRMALGVLIAVALAGAGLVLMSTTARKIAASVLLLFHFGGIVTAVTSIQPHNAPAPWLATELWVRVYRPYLSFMYLNNAYHFYSPEPGPPSMLWFHLTYKDGTMEWVKVPDRDKSVFPIHHTRLLSITEMSSESSPVPRLNNPNRDFSDDMQWDVILIDPKGQPVKGEAGAQRPDGLHFLAEGDFDGKKHAGLLPRRHDAVFEEIDKDGNKTGKKVQIPLGAPYDDPSLPLQPISNQYAEPRTFSREMTRTAARHVARTHLYHGDPANTLQTVKVYRLRHGIIFPREMANGYDVWDPQWYVIYFQGAYDADGNLLSVARDENGSVVEQDPLLYWQIPVFRAPKDKKTMGWPGMPPEDTELKDYLTIHAGSSPWDDNGVGTEKPR
jgi:hypothetical protein